MERLVLFHIEQASTTAELQGQCARALAAGFDGVELGPGATGSERTHVDAVGGMLSRRAAAREHVAPPHAYPGCAREGMLPAATTAEDDLKVIAVSGRCAACEIGPALKEVTTLIGTAAGMHAQCLNLTIPPLARGGGDGGFAHYQDALNFAYELLFRVRYEAEAAGVAVALEAAANGCLLSPVELREIIDAANSWAVGACIDVSRTLEIGSPADWLMTLGARVHAVRVCDIHPRDVCHRSGAVPPVSTTPDETVDIEAVAAALDEIGYDRPVIALGHGRPEEVSMGLAKLGCRVVKGP